MAELSIIVPVYNVAEYLGRCVESILKQEIEGLEILLVNDGSTDSSGEICDAYMQKSNLVKVIHKENGGLSSARNEGLKYSTGKFIGFVDSDDYVAENMFSIMLSIAKKENSEIVSCGYKEFTGEKCEYVCDNSSQYEYSNIEALENYLLEYGDPRKKIETVVWNKIYSKNLFEDIEFPIDKLYEDGYVTYRLIFKSNKVIHIDKELYYYYQREGSLSNLNFSERDVYSYDDWKEIFRFVFNNANGLSNLAANKYIRKNLNMYIKLCEDEYITNNNSKYKKLIRNDLAEDFDKLTKLNVSGKNKVELRLFFINYKLIKIYRKIMMIKG